ncbi:MAG: hypothetical protein ACI977_000493 [Candidatus Nanohaloarchaea archaeon]|jgi:hypothetical protein
MKKTVLALALVLFTTMVAGYNASATDSGDLESYESMINDRTASAPPFLSSMLGNQTVNVVIEDGQSENVYGAKISGLTLTEISNSGYENTTLEVTTDMETVENISSSEQPLDATVTALEEDRIEYETDSFWNSVRMSFIEMFLDS